jgi:transcriptional regulator with GAF, ATPase, and Fis domain
MTRKVKNRYQDFIKYLNSTVESFNPKSAFELLLAFISSQLDVDCCLLVNKFGEILYVSPTLKETRFSHTILKKALKQKRSTFIKNAIQEKGLQDKQSIAGHIFLSVICIILRDKTNKILGALYLDRHHPEKETFTELDLELAEELIQNCTTILVQEGLDKKELNKLRQDHGFEGIIGKSDSILKIFEQIKNVAPTDSNVFL